MAYRRNRTACNCDIEGLPGGAAVAELVPSLDCLAAGQPAQLGPQPDEDDDCDYLLQDSKRRKLEQRRKGGGGGVCSSRRGRLAKGGSPEPEVVDLSDTDSDRQLLQEAAAGSRGGGATASSRQAATPLPGRHEGAGRLGSAGAPPVAAAAGGSAPALDSKASALLQQLQEMQARMRAAREQGTLSDDADDASEGPGERAPQAFAALPIVWPLPRCRGAADGWQAGPAVFRKDGAAARVG